jgi:protein BCP1
MSTGKRKAESDGDSSSEESEVDLLIDPTAKGEKGEVVDVEFEFFDPKKDDFWAIRQFLQTCGLENKIFPKQDFTELAECIGNQTAVGTMIKSDADPEQSVEKNSLIGFLSAINMQFHEKSLKIIPDLKNFLIKRCPDESTRMQIVDSFDSKRKIGWLICKRMINTPLEMISTLHQALTDDIKWAVENDDTQEERDSYKFSHFLILSKLMEEQVKVAQKNKNKRAKVTKRIVYTNFEDEYYASQAVWSFQFELSGGDEDTIDMNRGGKTFGQAMLVDAKTVYQSAGHISQLAGEILMTPELD